MTITITTICLNPCFDRTVEVDSLQISRVNRIRSARDDLGGKGINVAVVAKRLGLDVQCLGLMGKEGSVELGEMMDRERLTHHFLPVPGRVRTNMKIYSRDGQGVTELNEPGAAVNVEILEKFTQMACENTKNSDIIVLTGSLPPGCPEGNGNHRHGWHRHKSLSLQNSHGYSREENGARRARRADCRA